MILYLFIRSGNVKKRVTSINSHEKEPDTLFHYTNQLGMLGIMQSNTLWATKIHYLNDESEFQLALNLAKAELGSQIEAIRSTNGDPYEIRRRVCLLDNISTIENINICVISLSEAKDLLSQWRAYADGVGGFSIGFNVETLRSKAAENGFELVKCIYEEDCQLKVIQELILETLRDDFNINKVQSDPSNGKNVFVMKTGGDFAEKLIRIAPVLKNESFREEKEWRLISKPTSVRAMKFRPGKSSLLPYIDFNLGESKSFYLKEVVSGPSPNKHLMESSAKMLMSKYGFDSNRVVSSKIPFKNW